jgi:hypothetical protein
VNGIAPRRWESKRFVPVRKGWRSALGLGVAGFALVLVFFPLRTMEAQQVPSLFPQPLDPHGKVRHGDSDDALGNDFNAQVKRARLLNSERQKEIVSDTAKLLKLAQELNEQLVQSGGSKLSAAQMRELAEIAKLAKNVREKMTFGLGGSTPPPDPFSLSR